MSFDSLFDGSNAHMMTCASCSHSELQWSGTDFALRCAKTGKQTEATCDDFQYEPGSDEGESCES